MFLGYVLVENLVTDSDLKQIFSAQFQIALRSISIVKDVNDFPRAGTYPIVIHSFNFDGGFRLLLSIYYFDEKLKHVSTHQLAKAISDVTRLECLVEPINEDYTDDFDLISHDKPNVRVMLDIDKLEEFDQYFYIEIADSRANEDL